MFKVREGRKKQAVDDESAEPAVGVGDPTVAETAGTKRRKKKEAEKAEKAKKEEEKAEEAEEDDDDEDVAMLSIGETELEIDESGSEYWGSDDEEIFDGV